MEVRPPIGCFTGNVSSTGYCIQIWTLPKLALIFPTDGLSTLLNVLVDSHTQLRHLNPKICHENRKTLISRNFVPFVTSPTPGVTFSGVFFTGYRPNWILAENKSGVQIYPSGHSVVHTFAACSLWDSKGDFLLYTDEYSSLSFSGLTFVHLLYR